MPARIDIFAERKRKDLPANVDQETNEPHEVEERCRDAVRFECAQKSRHATGRDSDDEDSAAKATSLFSELFFRDELSLYKLLLLRCKLAAHYFAQR